MLVNIFLQVLSMTISASIIIILVMLIRPLLKRLPKIYSYLLWLSVLIRLIIPFSLNSLFSLMPKVFVSEPISNSVLGISRNILDFSTVERSANQLLQINANDQNLNFNKLILVLTIIWLCGLIITISTNYLAYRKLKLSLSDSILLKDNIYLSNNISSPLTFGIIKPKIYLPKNLDESSYDFIILHEQVHIKRKDHLSRFIGSIALSIHWFNPLVWIAYNQSQNDMEMACDESVINQLGISLKKDYVSLILDLSVPVSSKFTLAFNGQNTKKRIKNLLDYKKPKTWLLLLSALIVGIVSFSLLSNPNVSAKKIKDLVINEPSVDLKATFLDYPDDYSIEDGIKDGLMVNIHGQLQAGSDEQWNNFKLNVDHKKASHIDMLRVTIEGEPILYRLIYDGESFTLYLDYSRDHLGSDFEEALDYQTKVANLEVYKFKYLKVFEDQDSISLVGTDDLNLSSEEYYSDGFDYDKAIIVNEYYTSK